MVERQGLILIGIGLAAGMVGALAIARAVTSVSFTDSAMGTGIALAGTGSLDPLIYVAAAVFLSAVGALATYFPARRAASVDPMRTLRMD